MSRLRILIKYWLPMVLWMIMIFLASTDAMSPEHTSRIIGPLLHWIFPAISDETVHLVQIVIRKGAHATEYAVLALLIWRARWQPVRGDRRPWCWRAAAFAFLLALLYAASDEFHQSFVPTRTGQLSDVALDGAGAGVVLLFLWALECRRLRRLPPLAAGLAEGK